VEEEGKGNALLPTNFLRQLIGVYGSNVPNMVPKFLDQAMANFAKQQETVRETVSKTLGPFLPPGIEEVGRKNMAMMERAMTLFTPFYPAEMKAEPLETPVEYQEEITALRAEVERLQQELAALKPKAK
jgi:polyhydroxyalkanoate synthesis regulator protein